MSRVADVRLEFAARGSGFPAAVTPCQTRTAATARAERPRNRGRALHSRRCRAAGGANTWAGAEGMVFTLTLMTLRFRLTRKQNHFRWSSQAPIRPYALRSFFTVESRIRPARRGAHREETASVGCMGHVEVGGERNEEAFAFDRSARLATLHAPMLLLHDPRCADYGSSQRPEQPARVVRTATHLRAAFPGRTWRTAASDPVPDDTLLLAHTRRDTSPASTSRRISTRTPRISRGLGTTPAVRWPSALAGRGGARPCD